MKKPVFATLLTLIVYLLSYSPILASSITLSSENNSFKQEEAFEVVILVDSIQETLGADIVLEYDPQYLSLDQAIPGDIYPNYPEFDLTDEDGIVNMSAVSDFTQPTIPNGIFATLTFTPISSGNTYISLDFDPDSTNTTGIIPFDGNQNLITSPPESLSISISGGFPTTMFLIGGLILAIIIILIVLVMKKKKPSSPKNMELHQATGLSPTPTLPSRSTENQPPSSTY